MPIYAKRTSNEYSVAPEGLWRAVCIDVIDLGLVKTSYNGKEKEKHMVRVRWMLECKDEKTGKNHWASKRFNLSLHEKADLCKTLQTWRGRSFTAEELQEFDVESVIGANCQIQIQHNIKDGGATYANVVAVVKAANGTQKMSVPSDYVRECDREHRVDLEGNANGYQADDEDIPF